MENDAVSSFTAIEAIGNPLRPTLVRVLAVGSEHIEHITVVQLARGFPSRPSDSINN
ncbi:hypothetical protein [Pantoea sp. A4]|uniref:hypothetical protein n=1 Tax=Pantoea sp. A4 TaxID=1225184 RepID=UPI000374D4DE|nr:hypothetical protein [Pantoea sp. A4]